VKGNRKQAVSIRLGTADVRKMKQLAARLGVRDSDVLRYALKTTLNRLATLCDPEITGANLVPAIVEAGPEFIRYFDLDAVRLDAILNSGADASRQVSHEDVSMVSLTGSQPEFAMLRLRREGSSEGVRLLRGKVESIEALREHLYEKYVYRRSEDGYRDPALGGVQADAGIEVEGQGAGPFNSA